MGYRNYIGYISKEEHNKIKSLSLDELYDFYGLTGDNRYKGVYDFGPELYEFGKYVDFVFPKGTKKKFFTNKETQKYYEEDHEFFIVTKRFLEYAIKNYTEKVQKYYRTMLAPFFSKDEENPSEFLNSIKTEHHFPDNRYTFDFSKITPKEQTALFLIIEHVRSMAREWGIYSWGDMRPYNLEDGEQVTTSWKYEYETFELVRIYKTFDWKNNVMIYYGY